MSITNVYTNISLEIPTLILSIFLLVVCYLRKKTAGNIEGLNCVIIANTGVLISQIIEWISVSWAINNAMTPLKLFIRWFFFISEYWLGAYLVYAILLFIISTVNLVSDSKKNYNHLLIISSALGIVQSLLMTSAVFTKWPFYFNPSGHLIETASTSVLFALFYSIISLSFVYLLVKEYKTLGLRRVFVFATYIVLTLSSSILDTKFNTVVSYVIRTFVILLFYFEIDLKESERAQTKEKELAKKEAEMTTLSVNLMMSQIQPHFLYNSLSTIAYLCTEDPNEAEKATNEFANYLRANLKSINSKDPIPFSKELDHVQNYLKVEQRRFADQMNVIYDIKTTDFLIPPLALQPIVENSVHHGVETRYEPTTIRVTSEEKENEYLVIVEDDGPGFDINQKMDDDRLHVGINSTKTRLREMVHGYMEIESEIGIGTKVTIHIPKGVNE